MGLSTKQNLSIAAIGGWLLAWIFDPLITIWRLNVEKWAAEHGLDQLYKLIPWASVQTLLLETYSWLGWVYEHITGQFGLGLAIGSFILAFWDPISRLRGGSLEIGNEPARNAVLVPQKGRLRITVGVSLSNTSTRETIKGVEVLLTKIWVGAERVLGEMQQELSLVERPEMVFDINPKATRHVGVLAFWQPDPKPEHYKLEGYKFGPFGGGSLTGSAGYADVPPVNSEFELAVSASGYRLRTERFVVSVVNGDSVTVVRSDKV